MGLYVTRRILQTIPLLIIISLGFFTLINLVPGGPMVGQGMARRLRPEQAEALQREFGLDQPLPLRYLYWLAGNDWARVDRDGDGVKESYGSAKGILRGDFGVSIRTRQPVFEVVMDYLPNTVYLMTITLLVVAAIAIPVGVISAVKQYSAFDFVVTTLSFIGQAIPEFWLGLILILVFYAWLKNPFTGEPLMPAGGMATLGADFSLLDRIHHLILPVTMGMVGWVTWYSRFLRSSMLDIINKEYIRTAIAKGASQRRVLYKHALKNALLPLVTIFALDLPYIFAGSLYVELLFSWPGMGRLYYQSAVDRDYPLLMALLMVGTALVLAANLLADILYAYLDPRIRYD
jgi:peptide/nickel transport system permease protein